MGRNNVANSAIVHLAKRDGAAPECNQRGAHQTFGLESFNKLPADAQCKRCQAKAEIWQRIRAKRMSLDPTKLDACIAAADAMSRRMDVIEARKDAMTPEQKAARDKKAQEAYDKLSADEKQLRYLEYSLRQAKARQNNARGPQAAQGAGASMEKFEAEIAALKRKLGARTDASVSAGKTCKQLASELRRSAASDRSGRGTKPLPGRAHGEPNEWSMRSAYLQEAMAEYLDGKIAEGQKTVTEEDVRAMLAMRARWNV